MRKLIYSMMVSLDGYIETSNRKIDWVIIDEELHRFANDQAREEGAILYGRRLYEVMVEFWPTADLNPSAPSYEVEFARIWKDKPKIVFSRTLDKVEWSSRLVKDDVAGEVASLKAQPGNDLSVGGATLAAAMIRLGLLDQFRSTVHPAVLGCSTPFLPTLDKTVNQLFLEQPRVGSGD